jgi:hypothetical protein
MREIVRHAPNRQIRTTFFNTGHGWAWFCAHAESSAMQQEPLMSTISCGYVESAAYVFFNAEEAAFIEAAVARLLPVDDAWAGTLEARVPNYIDSQLAGPWGAGKRHYRGGSWQHDTSGEGQHLPPSALFRTAIAAINDELKGRTPFAKMEVEEQDAYLKSLETSRRDLGGVPSKVFFAMLWDRAMEGFSMECASRLNEVQACRGAGI